MFPSAVSASRFFADLVLLDPALPASPGLLMAFFDVERVLIESRGAGFVALTLVDVVALPGAADGLAGSS